MAPDVRPLPASLVNIYTELVDDLGVAKPSNGDLRPLGAAWCRSDEPCAHRGAGRPASHRGKGWEPITEHAIRALAQRDRPLVAILWVATPSPWSRSCANTESRVSPACTLSPLSAHRGFFGSRPFSKANAAVVAQGNVRSTGRCRRTGWTGFRRCGESSSSRISAAPRGARSTGVGVVYVRWRSAPTLEKERPWMSNVRASPTPVPNSHACGGTRRISPPDRLVGGCETPPVRPSCTVRPQMTPISSRTVQAGRHAHERQPTARRTPPPHRPAPSGCHRRPLR